MKYDIIREMIEEGRSNVDLLDWLHSTAAVVRYDVQPDLEDELLNMIRVLLKGENE